MAQAVIIENKSLAPTTRPYPPSWLDRLQDWVDRLPVPYWVTYMLFSGIIFVLFTLVQWQTGAYPVGALNLFHIWFCFEIALILAWMHYLDRVAVQALITSRPTLDLTESEFAEIKYRLAHMRARTTWLASLASLVLAFILVGLTIAIFALAYLAQLAQLPLEPISLIAFFIPFAIIWAVLGVWYFHTFHQLRLISQIYTQHTRINMYDPGPIYAFSGVSARSAFLFVLVPTLWIATNPILFNFAIGLWGGISIAAIGLLVFILPLWGIHVRLVHAKDELLGQVGTRLQTTTNALHQVTDTQTWDNASKIKDAIL